MLQVKGIDFDVDKSTEKRQKLLSHTTHHSYSTFSTSIWENEAKPFLSSFLHFHIAAKLNMFYKSERKKRIWNKKRFFNELTYVHFVRIEYVRSQTKGTVNLLYSASYFC